MSRTSLRGRRCLASIRLSMVLILALIPPVSAQQSSAWREPIDIAQSDAQGRDAYGVLLCDDYQTLHVLWAKSHDGGSDLYYTSDAGGVLAIPVDVVATSNASMTNVSATITESDQLLHVIWRDSNVEGRVYYAGVPVGLASTPRSWSEPVVLLDRAWGAGISATSGGTIQLVYTVSDQGGLHNSVYIMRSVDSAVTWEQPRLIYEVASQVPCYLSADTAMDEAGRLHVGITRRSQEYGVDSELGYVRSMDGGNTWQSYQRFLSQTEATPNMAVMAPFAFGEDEIHLTWHDPRRMHTWSRDGGETWSDPVEIMSLGAGFGGANTLAKDSAGTLYVVVGVKNAVYSAVWDGRVWGQYELIDGHSMDPHHQQLEVCQGNRLHVTYDDFVQEESPVWYSTKQVNAPHIAQSPRPVPDALAAEIRPAAGQPADRPSDTETEPEARPLSTDALVPEVPRSRGVQPLLLSTLAALTLVGFALVVARRRAR